MWESILFCLSLVLNANEASNEMHLKQQEENCCLLSKECEAVYDSTTHAWIVKRKKAPTKQDPGLITKKDTVI